MFKINFNLYKLTRGRVQHLVRQEALHRVQHLVQQEARQQTQTPYQPILCKNQNRLPNENKIQERIIIPKNNIIDFHNNLNSNLKCKKTIVHVMDNSNGFGDYLRGSILLAEYAKHFNINFKMDISKHPLSKCINYIETDLLINDKINLICFDGNDNTDINLYSLINQFINSNKNNFYITTNLYYNMNLVSEDIKDYINYFFKFKQQYYDIANNLFNLDKYKVLHIRCKDDEFNIDFNDDYLLTEIIKLQLNSDTIIISNNYSLKIKLNKLFGFYFIDQHAHHTGSVTNYINLESTIIEYIILTKSSYNYCFSYYHHGSGFSEQCSVLNNIPYNVVFLPNKNINITDNNILNIYYKNLIKKQIITNFVETDDNIDYNNIAFITLTNTGYIDYTLNCLQSLKNINIKKQLNIYCIGETGHSILKKNGFLCELINDEKAENFEEFRTNNWSHVTYYKFKIIYENLLNNEYVCITDGDIVYENKYIFNYLLNNIKDNDLLIQSEGIYHDDLCSGFMFIKSNENTISLFNPENVKKYKDTKGWDDQIYINCIKYNLKFIKLPLHLFPTGKHYYEYNTHIQPYLIHFNWVIGNEKKNKMEHYNKWYISKKVKICQHGTDGFGHQLEGTLRLLSLSLNNKAEYQYNYDKKYTFEHTNFEIDKLTQYLTTALKIISNKTNENDNKQENNLNFFFKEQRTFDDILKNDKNVENAIYCYDGVSSNITNILPPNFESNSEVEKSLPKLREAFVEKNIYLPTKSYDNTLINVCCHIRLGDAVGQRILDNENIFKVIKEFQKYNKYRIIIHTDGDVKHLQCHNTIIYDSTTDVLQVLSDFIYADILIITYSSLSIAAHLLADNKQNVIYPTNAGPTFKYRILNKCISTLNLHG